VCVSVHVYVCVFTSLLVSHTLCSRRLCHHLHVCYSIPAAFCLFTHTMDSVTTALTWSQADSVTGEPGTTGNTHHLGRGSSLCVCVCVCVCERGNNGAERENTFTHRRSISVSPLILFQWDKSHKQRTSQALCRQEVIILKQSHRLS